jgi:flagellar biosynthesis protein FliP
MKRCFAIALIGVLLAATPALAQRTAPRAAPRTGARANVTMPAVSMVDPPAGTELDPTAPPTVTGVDLQAQLQSALSPQRTSSTVQVLLLLTVLALVPSILVLMTSFTRIVVVLGLLRQAMATQQLPPNQVLLGLALFMTLVVMAPVYNKVHASAIVPYTEGKLTQAAAMHQAETHVRDFMINQVEAGGNTDDVYLFLDEQTAGKSNLVWADVPTLTLIPAFVVSELKISFLMGFRIYLPFLIIDMVIASVLISMGMLMLPPVLISLPFKLLLFVLVDGWHLVVRTLMMSFGPS